jgi:hypothetical protein
MTINIITKMRDNKELDLPSDVFHEEAQDGTQRVDPAIEKALLRKLDKRIIPMIVLLYLMSFMDRGTRSNIMCKQQ